MKFWHMQLHPDDPVFFNTERVKKLLKEKAVIGFGEWEKGESLIPQFRDKMKIGDIVAIKKGETPIALVKVIGEYFLCNEINHELDWFEHRRKVEVIDFYKSDYDFYIDQPRRTLSICKNLNTATSKTIIGWYNKIMGLEQIDLSSSLIDVSLSLLTLKNQIILQGPPGTGKTRLAVLIAQHLPVKEEDLSIQGTYQIVQFHPAYSYEDFVRGIVAETDDKGNISYNVKNKVLAELAQKAQENPNGKYVLIIDEINRANLPSVLGELIYALEYRGEPVVSMYEHGNSGREIILPKNLYIIGTMNTADRSVGHIDYAIRRRFAFINVLPDYTVIKNEQAQKLFKEVAKLFEQHLSSDFQKDDVMIGHSYFIVEDDVELNIKLEYEIKPILKEYLKDGILNESAAADIENLKV